MMSNKNYPFIALLVFLFLSVFLSGYFLGQNSQLPEKFPQIINKEEGKPQDLDFSIFWNAWEIVKNYYVETDKINQQDMIYGAISGMVESIKDPYSVFLTPKESQKLLEDISGSFEGVGMEIGIKDNQLTVVAPLKNTPADKAGIRAGDKIIKIDQTLTQGLILEEAVNLIRGVKETEVSLVVLREGKQKEIKIVRDIINIPVLEWEIKEGDIAYIRIYQFSENLPLEFQVIVSEILSSPAQKIILDLRNNPGGYLEKAIDIASRFLEKGELVTIEDYGKGKIKEHKANGNPLLKEFPLVILINKGSASGSEIVAGALRDQRQVKLIGETSFGKGLVQELKSLKEGANIKITVARWLTPSGLSISEKGLEPDIKVEITEEDYEKGNDPQLKKAIEVVKEIE